MDISHFYRLGSKLLMATIQAHPLNLNYTEDANRQDDVARLLLGNYKNITFPVVFKQSYGHQQRDVLDTGTAILLLISDKMKTVLEENNLTGWKTFPIHLLDKKGVEISGYHGWSITGRCGKIDYSKSEIIQKRLVPTGPLSDFYRGTFIGLDKWDGSDFFIPDKYYGIMVTDKATAILKKAKLSNLTFINLADTEIISFSVKVHIENMKK